MKYIALATALLVAAPLAASADVTKEDIKKLVAAGISDDVIVSFIRANGPVVKLSSDDLIELKGTGASERVLNTLLNPTPKYESTTPPPKKEYVYSSPAVVYTYDYYYPSRSYYYSDCYPRYSYYSYYPSVYYSRGWGGRSYGRSSGCGW